MEEGSDILIVGVVVVAFVAGYAVVSYLLRKLKGQVLSSTLQDAKVAREGSSLPDSRKTMPVDSSTGDTGSETRPGQG